MFSRCWAFSKPVVSTDIGSDVLVFSRCWAFSRPVVSPCIGPGVLVFSRYWAFSEPDVFPGVISASSGPVGFVPLIPLIVRGNVGFCSGAEYQGKENAQGQLFLALLLSLLFADIFPLPLPTPLILPVYRIFQLSAQKYHTWSFPLIFLFLLLSYSYLELLTTHTRVWILGKTSHGAQDRY
jgi:hypothetical protein